MAIREMDIVDTRQNNVLVVLTNVMSFGNPRHPRKWHSQLRTKSKKIQNLGEWGNQWVPGLWGFHFNSGMELFSRKVSSLLNSNCNTVPYLWNYVL